MKVLFTGDYLPDYNRTKIIRVGLQQLGVTVEQLPFRKKNRAVKLELQKAAQDCDFIFMPSFTHREVAFVKKAVPNKVLIFDPLISRYLTKVFDYKLVSRYGLSALRNYYRDKCAMDAADFVVTDTVAHQKYFHDTFHIENDKMGPLYIGNDFTEYYPKEKKIFSPSGPIHVGFYGGFIPLQGVMNILAMVEILKDQSRFHFELIGSGFEFEKAKDFVAHKKLNNVTLPGWVSAQELPARINDFDIALGIFGETEKSDLVIPNKVYHYAACAKPILTKRSPAICELFSPDEDLFFVNPNPNDMAKRLIDMADHPELCISRGQSAYTKLRIQWGAPQVASRLVEYYQNRKQ